MEFSRRECWSGYLFSSPGNLQPGIKPGSPALQANLYHLSHQEGKDPVFKEQAMIGDQHKHLLWPHYTPKSRQNTILEAIPTLHLRGSGFGDHVPEHVSSTAGTPIQHHRTPTTNRGFLGSCASVTRR